MTDTARFLALGDSYTCGEGVPTEGTWPFRLVERLREEGLEIAPPEVVARTGWTTDELLVGIGDSGPLGEYHLVTLLIGVNNQYRARDLAAYEEEFGQLLEIAIARAGGDPGRVLVLSIPDWGVTPFADGRDRAAIRGGIDAFNAVNRAAARAAGAGYVDVTESSRRAGSDRSLLVADGLHPAAAMYDEWARLALPAARRALLRSRPSEDTV
jgi:lysophospholipase L1-like esterase